MPNINQNNEIESINKEISLSQDRLEDMKKEDLIISLLKSKERIFELFNDNNNNKISDIRRIINRLRDILPKKDRKEIKDKLYKI